jgi:hypothetical protein
MTKDTRFPRAALIVNMRARRVPAAGRPGATPLRGVGHPTKLIVGEVLDHRAGTVVASGSL